jgi:hypothetical protein
MICRTVEDAAMVFNTITGQPEGSGDESDALNRPHQAVVGRIGVDAAAPGFVDKLRELGAKPTPRPAAWLQVVAAVDSAWESAAAFKYVHMRRRARHRRREHS